MGIKMKITEINTVVKSVEYTGEIYINLCELDHLLKTGFRIEPEECLILPYYIQNHRRMELYQYEFRCTCELDFEAYLLKLTGKERIEEVPKEIYYLRRRCFSTCDEPNGLADFLDFLLTDNTLKEEIERAFGHYTAKNLYAVIY